VCFEPGARRSLISDQEPRLMAHREQCHRGVGADETGRAGAEDLHLRPVWAWIRAIAPPPSTASILSRCPRQQSCGHAGALDRVSAYSYWGGRTGLGARVGLGVGPEAGAVVEAVESGHLVVAQFEIEHLEIRLDPRRVR